MKMVIVFNREKLLGIINGQRKVIVSKSYSNENKDKISFYISAGDSDSESDSDNDDRERKIHVEIKPLNNGSAPISASVDELRATVGNLSLSPLGGASLV